jgi:hypothetical protein
VLRGSVEGILDDWEGFRILIRDYETGRIVRIRFDSVLAYQSRYESDLHGELQRSEGYGRGNFYRVLESEFVERFRGDTLRSFSTLKHFAILTDSDCIDIITPEEPDVHQL